MYMHVQKKQHYKLHMFRRLYYILMGTVLVIGIFFVVCLFSFSNSLAEGQLLTFVAITMTQGTQILL